ncbi:hypothetical protein VTN00DRAFT_3505 [Thermoascus crustaceus]|uniref:uncharacterized protein n=1 Tax=Thermoascus crustaceus TaxID=5088 RepID=UPI003742F88A
MLDEQHEKPVNFAQPSSDKNSYTWGRIGLMVGIGAAIARPEQGCDIRLGDIVVSQPDRQSGGVVQYDLGKATSGHHFERKGILNMPPEALLKALAKLQAQHEIQPSKIPGFLQEMIKRNPQMAKSRPGRPSYMHQGEENDRLFKATSPHVDGFGCRNCDPDQEIPQDNRDSNEPEIHYGVIASGNTLVKDAATRDWIVQNTGEECICLEMEAAGLMNSFPCLVIRGISIALQHKGSGLWFLQSEVFANWKMRSNSFLWLHGKPGCGKTILSCTIVEDLMRTSSSSQALLYFYFDFNDTMVVVPMKASHYKNTKGMELQLAHFSIKEYLISNRLDEHFTQCFQEIVARASIAAVCLAYLLHLDQDLQMNEIRGAFPLAQYCAQYWMGHAASGGYSTALQAATAGGHEKIVQILLDKGADVNAEGGDYGTALQEAAYKGLLQ